MYYAIMSGIINGFESEHNICLGPLYRVNFNNKVLLPKPSVFLPQNHLLHYGISWSKF